MEEKWLKNFKIKRECKFDCFFFFIYKKKNHPPAQLILGFSRDFAKRMCQRRGWMDGWMIKTHSNPPRSHILDLSIGAQLNFFAS